MKNNKFRINFRKNSNFVAPLLFLIGFLFFISRAHAGQDTEAGTCFLTQQTINDFDFEFQGPNQLKITFNNTFSCEGDTSEGLTGEFNFVTKNIHTNLKSGINTFVQTGTFNGTIGGEEVSADVKFSGLSKDSGHFVSGRMDIGGGGQDAHAHLDLDFDVPGCLPGDAPGLCDPRYSLEINKLAQ